MRPSQLRDANPETAMTTPLSIADRYLATWNEPDAPRRQTLIGFLDGSAGHA